MCIVIQHVAVLTQYNVLQVLVCMCVFYVRELGKNSIGIERVKEKLANFADKFDVPIQCIIEALEISLKRNCLTFRGQYWLQSNGTAIGPKNSCSYGIL